VVDWTGADEDQGDVNVWEDNWDDDNVEDDFSQQLRSDKDIGHCLKQLQLGLGVRKFWPKNFQKFITTFLEIPKHCRHFNNSAINYTLSVASIPIPAGCSLRPVENRGEM